MKRDALGAQALENYTYDELLTRWEKADQNPDRYVFDYETGRLYERQGTNWVNAAEVSNKRRYIGEPPTVEDRVVQEAATRAAEVDRPDISALRAEEYQAKADAETGLPEGLDPTGVLEGDLSQILLGEAEPPTGWHVTEYEMRDGTLFKALENEEGTTGFALPTRVLSGEFTDLNTGEVVKISDQFDAQGLIAYAGNAWQIAQDEAIGPTPIGGLPEDYTAQNINVTLQEEYQRVQEQLGGYLEREMADFLSRPQDMEPVPVKYWEGDQLYQFGGKDPTYLAEVQQSMVDAGYLTEASFGAERGIWGRDSANAMGAAMYDATVAGRSWAEILQIRALNLQIAEQHAELEERQRPAALRQPFVATARLLPDYTTVSETVRGVFASVLGRDPHDWEMTALADQMTEDYRAANAVLTAAERANYDAANRAFDTGQPQSAGEFTEVDPAARFQDRFRGRFEGEMDIIENREELQQNLGVLLTNLSGLENAVGGI